MAMAAICQLEPAAGQVGGIVGTGVHSGIQDVLTGLTHGQHGGGAGGVGDMVGLGVIGDQHAVGAAADGLVGIHVAIHAEVVGEDEALKAPLVTQDVLSSSSQAPAQTVPM